ncbi:MAG: MarR family transcriptional regulator [Chthoniobacterales bacterium]
MKKESYVELAMFRGTLRKFLRFSEDAASEAGLAPKQHQALLAIKGFPGERAITIGQLAEQLQIRHHSAVGIVDRLEEGKYLKRSISPTDRRKVQLDLTQRGEQILERLSHSHHQEMQMVGPKLIKILQSIIGEETKRP